MKEKKQTWFLIVGPVPSKNMFVNRVAEKCKAYSKKQALAYVLFKVLRQRFPDAPIYPEDYTVIPMSEDGQLEFEFK